MTHPLLLRASWVFDGHAFLDQQDVLLVDGRVAAVGQALGGDAEVVDCSGSTVTPGIVDCHVHLAWAGLEPIPTDVGTSRRRAIDNARALLLAGVTTVRDTGGPIDVVPHVAELVRRGEADGPDVLSCGQILCAHGGHGTEIPLQVPIARECAGAEGFAAGVRAQLAAGARLVKVTLNGAGGRVELTRPELQSLVDEAHRAGALVACHASVRDAVRLAVECGVDTIEHGNGIDEDLARAMREKGIALVPTVTIFEELVARLSNDTALPADVRATQLRASEQRVREHGPALRAVLGAGAPLAFGTDRVPGGEVVAVHAEAMALARHGLTPAQVLESATAGSAAALRLTDRGVLAPGARADLVVWPGDLASDMSGLATPRLVVKAGRPVLTR